MRAYSYIFYRIAHAYIQWDKKAKGYECGRALGVMLIVFFSNVYLLLKLVSSMCNIQLELLSKQNILYSALAIAVLSILVDSEKYYHTIINVRQCFAAQNIGN